MNELPRAIPASYRDPAGFIFQQEGLVFRQVNAAGQAGYEALMQSGLYAFLTGKKWLIPHTERNDLPGNTGAYKVLQPEQLAFTGYAYEWSFSMLQDAALLTLRIARAALDHGLILKDATPFNVQFHKGAMTFIDTLSFAPYTAGQPWIAYRQFCESFLSPLLLMHYQKQHLPALPLAWPEGIPLQLASQLLPFKSRLSMLTYLHIHLHAKMAAKKKGSSNRTAVLPKNKLTGLLSSLELLVQSLRCTNRDTTWGDYYQEAATRADYLDQKNNIISQWTKELTGIKTAVDFGANEGNFSLPLAERSIHTIAADADPVAINTLYEKIRGTGFDHIHPLIIDFTYPSPAIGTGNTERASFLQRLGQRDLGYCLAFIHHLCIGKNIPLQKLAALLAASCQLLLIEFVPKTDEKVQILLQQKEDIYPDYHAAGFEEAFSTCFRLEKTAAIPGSTRTLYLMRRK